jgi:hypothetical protein
MSDPLLEVACEDREHRQIRWCRRSTASFAYLSEPENWHDVVWHGVRSTGSFRAHRADHVKDWHSNAKSSGGFMALINGFSACFTMSIPEYALIDRPIKQLFFPIYTSLIYGLLRAFVKQRRAFDRSVTLLRCDEQS